MKRTLCLFLALILAVGICFSAPVTITASAAFNLESGEEIPASTHIDANCDYKCDYNCGYVYETLDFSDAKVLTANEKGILCIDGVQVEYDTHTVTSTHFRYNQYLPSGKYKLSGDVTMHKNGFIYIEEGENVSVDLNGYTWNCNDCTYTDGTFSVYDTSKDEKGKITSSSGLILVYGDGEFNLYSGTIENSKGGVVLRVVEGTANLYGGKLKSNEYLIEHILYENAKINLGGTVLENEEGYPEIVSVLSLEVPQGVINVADYTGESLTVEIDADYAGKIKILEGVENAEEAEKYTVNYCSEFGNCFLEKTEYDETTGELYVYVVANAFTQQPSAENGYTVDFNNPDATFQWYEVKETILTPNNVTAIEGVTFKNGKWLNDGWYVEFFTVDVKAGDMITASTTSARSFDLKVYTEDRSINECVRTTGKASVTIDSDAKVIVGIAVNIINETTEFEIELIKISEVDETETDKTLQNPECGKTYVCMTSVGENVYLSDVVTVGHNIVSVDAKAPTCTEIGWDAYEYCTECDYTTYEEKEALDHDWSNKDGICERENCGYKCPHEKITDSVCVACGGNYCGTDTTKDKVIWFYDEATKTITISGSGAMANYYRGDDMPWYNYQNDITKVVIENGVTTIGEFALNYCSFLTSVTIPESVTSIGDFAFAKCTSLEAVTIGEGVTTIGDYAFSDCTFLTTLTIGNKVSTIGDSAFSNCAGLTSVTIPDSVTTISGLAFDNCSNLTSVTIPKNVTTIGRYAFDGCAALTSINVDGANTTYSSVDGVLFNKDKTELIYYPLGKDATSYTIPESVTTIDEGAFKDCTALTSVTIGKGVTEIDDYAFDNCPNVLLFVDKNNNYVQNYATANNINYVVDGSGELEKLAFILNADGESYCVRANDKSISGELKIPATYNGKPVTAIDGYAFDHCTSLTSVTIPDGVISIGGNAFYYCGNLKEVTIPKSVTTIGDEPFWYAISIEKITVDDDNKFYSSTDGILFNEEKTELICYPSAKKGESYEIPDTVKSISQAAFSDCLNLKSIAIPDNVTTINEKTFENCSSLESITIPSGVESIGNNAFHNCVSLESVTIPSGVTSIGQNAFHNCKKLESVIIPNGVTSIGNYAFSGCSELKTVTILSETVSVELATFYDCSESLRFFTVDGSEAENSIDTDGKCLSFTLNDDGKSYSVTDCGRLISGELEIPDKFNGKPVTEIGNYAFPNCTSLTSVTIPGSVTTIADWAFSSCTELTEIKVAEGNTNYLSVDGILFNAEKTELLCYPAGKKGNYEIPTTVTEIAPGAFSGNTSLESVTIPDRVTTIGEGAFMNCTALTSVTIPDSVTTIGRYAFQGCTSLASVTIGDRVKTIDWMTFYDCTELTSVTIGKGVKEINGSAFDCCNKLSTVNVPCDWDTENPLYAFDENVNVDVADHKEIIYVDNNDGTHTAKYSCCGTVIGEPEDHSFNESGYCECCKYQCPHEKYSNGVCDVCECYCPHTNKEPVYKSYEDNTNQHYKYYECCGMKEWAGYHNDENGDTKCDECEVQLVAKAFLEPWTSQGVRMGDNYFVSLENAVDKVNEIYGEELILLSDATIADGKTITLESAVFNTNGNKLTVNGILVLSAKKYTGVTIPEGIIGEGTIKIGENTFKFADNEKWSCAEESQHTGSVQTCVGYLCELCGNYYGEANDNHDIVIDEAKAPTCTETGLTEGKHCSRCENATVEQEEVPALNHKGTLVPVEAEAKTCTTVGWEAYEYCTACDYTTYVEIPASHEIVKVNAKAKTCKEAGHNAHEYCTACDYTTKVEIPASHELQEVKAKAPTCTEIGYDAYEYCTACTYTTYKEKAALNHNIVIDKAVEATCTKTGLTEGSHCSRCNDKTVKQNVIPTKAHTEVIIPKVAPTLTSTGLTEGKKCSVCGTVTVSQQVIAKLVLVAPVITSITSTTGGVKFTWGAVPYAAKYKIYRKTYHPSTGKWDAKWKKINKVEVKGTEYVDSTAKLGTQYMYLVKAVDGKVTKNSAASSIVTFKISPTPTIHLKSNGIKVKWAETVVSAENYRIYRAEYNESTKKYNSYKKVKTVKGTTKSWTDTSVKSGKKYKYCVKAVRGSVVCDKVQTKPIYYLTKPKVTVATATNGIVVNWSAKGASKYRVYRSELQNGVWSGYKEIATPNGKTKTYTDTTAVAGVQYKYKIKSVKGKTGIVSSATKAVTR